MNKYLLCLLLSSLFISLPVSAKNGPTNDVERMEELSTPGYALNNDALSHEGENADFTAVVKRNVISVTASGCQGKTLRIYNLVGDLVYERSIDSDFQTMNAKVSKGIYLVNISNKVRKVIVRD